MNTAGEDITIVSEPKFREFSLPLHDGGNGYILISFCPWFSAKLPESLRNEWFDRLGALNLEPGSKEIPKELRSERWYLDSPTFAKDTE